MRTPSDDDNEEPDLLERFWNALWKKVMSYMHIVKYVVLGLSAAGWFVYLGFAIWCRFGDEESVRMLGISLFYSNCNLVIDMIKYCSRLIHSSTKGTVPYQLYSYSYVRMMN